MERRRILDEFVSVTGYHRKHEISLLAVRSGCAAEAPGNPGGSTGRRSTRR